MAFGLGDKKNGVIKKEGEYMKMGGMRKSDKSFGLDDMEKLFEERIKRLSLSFALLGRIIFVEGAMINKSFDRDNQCFYDKGKEDFQSPVSKRNEKAIRRYTKRYKTKKEEFIMTFGDAIEALKNGKQVARKGWNGKGMFLWLKPGTEIKSEWCQDPELLLIAERNGGTITGLPTICMFTHDSTGRKAVLTGWLASQSDMLLEDWFIVEG